jgi:hypothetical protein
MISQLKIHLYKNMYFCTLFDKNYLLKGVVMLQSLLHWLPEARIYVLCMDATTKNILERFDMPAVILCDLSDVEDEDLLRVKKGRSAAEYCWTLSASFCWYLMQSFEHIDRVTYLDADLMFFSDVKPLIDEMNDCSICIVEHRFTPRLSHLEVYGRFNVEWVSFKRDADGMRCLKTWRDQCIDWCYARLEDGKLGDQKYLDAWPETYQSVCILQNIGAGVAPWNYANYSFSDRGGVIFVDDTPLVFYHFNQFQLLADGTYDYVSNIYSSEAAVPQLIYSRYEREIGRVLIKAREYKSNFSYGIRPIYAVRARRFVQQYIPLKFKNLLRRIGVQMW